MKPTDAEINAAITTLRNAGFTVTAPQADSWIAPKDLWRKLSVGSLARFLDRLHHSRCPQVQRRVGESGRLLAVRPTPELLAFLCEPSQPGKRM